ncbi:MAG: SpoIIE family protein phosphatase [Vicinamibacteria bacterium]|nr:SpoIIE family protein phosphatase [Vicinamibacteria bacterium]
MKPSASVLLHLAVPSDSKYLSVVHERVREVAESNRFGALESEQWALAVEECAANSIEHAYAGRGDGEVDITLALEGDYLCAEICDEGQAFESKPLPPPADLKELARMGAKGGLGLTLVQKIADSVVRERLGRKNICRLVKLLPENPMTDKEKLASAEFQLRTLVDLGREFSTNFDPEKVASIALASLMGHLTILRAAFLTATPGGRLRVLASRGVKSMDSIEGLPWASLEGEGTSTETPDAPLRALRLDFIFRFTSGEEKGAILFSPRLSGRGFGEGEKNLIHAVGRQALAALTGSRAQELRIEKARADSELQVAREIQKRLLPAELPAIPGFDVAASSEACFSVGGDLFDVIPLDDSRFAIVLADVSGKGTPASLIMAFAHAAFRCLANRLPPVDLLARISELVRNANKAHRYLTGFYAELDPSTRKMIYVNAGHLPPAIIRGDETIELSTGGSVLGLLPGTTFEQGEVTLQPGDVLAIYSDGVSEAQSTNEDEFGSEGVVACVRALRAKPAAEILRLLEQSLFEFAAGRAFADDRTTLILKAL